MADTIHIRDPIYGDVEVSDVARMILETPQMQRLRYIKQLGFTYLVFPGANHSRFEHSVGSMHVTQDILDNINGNRFPEMPIIGLLHDIGHGPFSHQSEDVITKYTRMSHDQWGERVIKGSVVEDVIADSGIPLRKVLRYFRGEPGSELIGGALGSDRIDYIMRDAYYTGAAYGMVDYYRLRNKLTVYRGVPAIYEQGISVAELLLMARYFMYTNVYGHHTQRIAEGMFSNALSNAIEDGDVDPYEAAMMIDEQVMDALSESRKAKVLVGRIRARNLFKRAYYRSVDSDVKVGEVEDALGGAGLAGDEYVAVLKGFGGEKGDITVLDRNGKRIGTLGDFSPLMGTIDSLTTGKKKLLVACDKRNVARARSAVERLLG
ncbi:MAG: HD domain-containing protein [Candidatus Micrarchaeota archaeon]|nr:HD domain-containing protein [Candidatus Micrarchaeota archaeon]